MSALAQHPHSLAAPTSPTPEIPNGSSQMVFQQARSGVTRLVQEKLRDDVSVFDFMTADQIASVRRADLVEDVTLALQTAIDSHSTLYLPQGIYKISNKIRARPESRLRGENGRTTHIMGIHAGIIIEFPTGNYQCQVDNIYFRGNNCVGITTDLNSKDALRGYLNQAEIKNCNFGYEMSIGIDSALLCCRVRDSTFGYMGTGKIRYAMQAIRSFAAPNGNNTNLNTFDNVTINSCGNPDLPAVDLYGGEIWSWTNCDFEGCGRVIQMRSISLARFDGCWWERNRTNGWLVSIGATHNPVEFRRSQFINNVVEHVIEWDSGRTQGVVIDSCTFASPKPYFPLIDAADGSHELHPMGLISWRNNVVKNSQPANRLVTEFGYLERGNVKGWAVVSSQGDGRVFASSDPNITVNKSNVGQLTVIASQPAASHATRLCVVATPNNAPDVQCSVTSLSDRSFEIVCRRNGQPMDCATNVTWFGV